MPGFRTGRRQQSCPREAQTQALGLVSAQVRIDRGTQDRARVGVHAATSLGGHALELAPKGIIDPKGELHDSMVAIMQSVGTLRQM